MRRLLLVLVLAVAAFGVAGPAQASSGATVVKGLQSPDTAAACPAVPGTLATYTMSGGLIGCWYIDTFVEESAQPSGTARFSGTETFTGCIDLNGDEQCAAEENGTFHTTFTFTAKFSPVTFAELHGRCHHPIVSGDGVFANARGVINFQDNVNDGTADYTGPVSL